MKADQKDLQLDLLAWVETNPTKTPQIIDLVYGPAKRSTSRPSGSLKFDVWYGEILLIRNHRVPMYAACRALIERGIAGTARFYQKDGALAMTINIADGAKLTVSETNGAPRVVKYVPFEEGAVKKNYE